MSFGQWDADPGNALDRQPIGNNDENRLRNIHLMLPFEADVDAGGAVTFIISGLHQILIYGPGIELETVQAAALEATDIQGPPATLVNYDVGRVYRGPDPRVLQYAPLAVQPPLTNGNPVLDRVEAVNFKEPGRYLVVCGERPHFNEGMHGYVNVKA